ncbi:PP2C family protein-serine/threonine phosphatase [Micromonospora mirobrigensis]|uniref:Stage II sporulation protein E (SpoIIE) n=1 Tax=Micromonospora mirobrigensis TaxID=262898 RepID=A0A1C4U6S7_9ACTN|nr:PP2C family protein-serine/threonine phosphatase [Micromonospora mirobrigensis]SCE67423.1 Stage II sporulation protein E (SpoIIE) [Micromonospora mirobrigensis]
MTDSDIWQRAVADLVDRAHRLAPDDLTMAVNTALAGSGVAVTVYLVDVEQHRLRPLPDPARPARDPLSIDGSLPGRAFTLLEPYAAQGEPARLWVPVVNGTDRLGLLEVSLPPGTDPADRSVRDGCRLVAGLIGHLVTSKRAYGDNLRRATRSRPMAVSAELLWELLPPLTFATGDTVISGLLEPCYDVGGDAFDYALDDGVISLAILDGVGHGLPAALTTAVALAAIRATRRAGGGLLEQARAVDDAVRAEWADARFVTGVLATFDPATGVLRYVNAGHPAPLLLRRGHAVHDLTGGRRLPLGLSGPAPEPAELRWEPEDRLLLYTDGVTEARDAAGELFGAARLADLAERHTGSALPPAETLRRLSHAVADHQAGELADDATLLLVQWSPAAADRSVP